MKKRILYFLLAGVATLAGKKVLDRKIKEAHVDDLTKYCGAWSFVDKNQTYHELTITSDYSFWLDDRSLGTLLVEVTSEKLIVRDQYGFYLTFSYNDMLLYDEANDSAYLLSKKS
ncbi:MULTISPECIES: DUF4828 domain-containing protein [Enterococcus]|uniref:DUF4828 domain-containing protein n=1 Tax=Candidatus Enterococcus mangumiae TaxID=2230878 RepID=A0ABZ2T2V7_9ENTE|nr:MULTISPECIES: DUF4828 domain-containing protein [unclassified Enterococcus]MBO0461027.1 DUF4828 domain-containing protein [Enterococcus sp. DIV1298c]MBO0490807.1 DUF4828 domain-containing protein [Enterococcus sp. DIV1094]MBO1300685.1 DUF4828 domain-containing protein [Enterococcus sp. DIV1271a]